MRLRPTLWLTLLAVLVTAASGQARADDPLAQAAAEMQKAQASVDQHDYQAAIGHYLAARSLAPESSGPYLGLGLSYAALGRCDEAIPALEEYLRRKRNPHPSAATTLATCRAQKKAAETTAPPEPGGEGGGVEGGIEGGVIGGVVEAPAPEPPPLPPSDLPKGELHLHVEPVGGALSVNGIQLSGERRDYDAQVRPGLYQIEVDREGYDSAYRDVWVRSGKTSDERLVLVSQKPREKKHKLGVALGVILGVGAAAAAITVGIIYGTPKPPARFTTVVVP